MSDNSPAANENSKPKKQRVDSTLKKTASRVAAIQALYQILQNPPEDGIDEIIIDRASRTYDVSSGTAAHQMQEVQPNPKMLRQIVEGVLLNHGDIEDLISQNLPITSGSDKLGPLLAVILRAGAFEMVIGKTAPYKVIIGEYSSITGAFFNDAEAELVTAVLDKVAKKAGMA